MSEGQILKQSEFNGGITVRNRPTRPHRGRSVRVFQEKKKKVRRKKRKTKKKVSWRGLLTGEQGKRKKTKVETRVVRKNTARRKGRRKRIAYDGLAVS